MSVNQILSAPAGDVLPPHLTRLVVPIPAAGVDLNALARRVWALAVPGRLKVLFLGLAGFSPSDEDDTHLCLATVAALTRDDSIEVEVQIRPEGDWLGAVRHVLQPGDLVVCLAEQTIYMRGLGRRPLSSAVEWLSGAPVCVLAGVYSEEPPDQPGKADRRHWAVQLLAGAIPALIVGAFFLLQVRIELTTDGVARTLLLCASGLSEVGLIGIWSSLGK